MQLQPVPLAPKPLGFWVQGLPRMLKPAAPTEGCLFVLLPAFITCCSEAKGIRSSCWPLPADDGLQPAA